MYLEKMNTKGTRIHIYMYIYITGVYRYTLCPLIDQFDIIIQFKCLM